MTRFLCLPAAMLLLATTAFATDDAIASSDAEDLARDLEKAEAGDFDAMLLVGIALTSDNDKTNDMQGVRWLEMSSAGGNVTAYYNLGAIYQDGDPVEADPNKAIMYLTIAAELGEIRAMNRLAGIYYMGQFVPQNDVMAVKWGLCAAGLGNESAKGNIDRMRSQISPRAAALGAQAAESWAKARLPKKPNGQTK